jgi:hypothetical protein
LRFVRAVRFMKMPVFVSLKNATLGTIKTQNEFVAPFNLWGDEPATGDVYSNKKPMPKGTYWLYSRVDDAHQDVLNKQRSDRDSRKKGIRIREW